MFDLAIIGAGAGGISAAREARKRRLSYIILEASGRVGGRAHSVRWKSHALDLGAGWLHSGNRSPMVPLAEQFGLEIDRAPTPWREQYHALGFSRADQHAAFEAFGAFEEAVANPQPDDVAAHALPTGGSWNAFINALSGYLNGTSLECMSAEDYAAYSNAATECNWRLPSSYGTLLKRLAEGLTIEHGFAVSEVDWGSEHVCVRSVDDRSVAARTAITTVSTSVLASDAIRFLPNLGNHLDAAAQLPLGHVEKMFFALERAKDFPNDAHLIGNPHSSVTGSYMLRPMGIPVLESFFGGSWVAEATHDELEAMTRSELNSLFGSGFDARIQRIAQSSWKDDPLFRGAYSFARPGMHGAREHLSAIIADRLAFAGEACSPTDYSTVHGAWLSGIAAVERLFGEIDAG